MQDQKYGFIYIWHNTRKNKFYIGCHWGTEDDGYICSSKLMKAAHKRNPEYFRRRVLQRIYTNRKELVELEHRWLQLIPDDKLGVRYYNVAKHQFGHWSLTPDGMSAAKRSGATRRGKPQPCTPEKAAKISAAKKGKRFTEEHKAALREARKGMKLSEAHKQRISDGLKRSDRYAKV